MKFSLFVHMERVNPAEDERQLYEEMLELCRIADEGGMHAIWTGEHHGMSFTIAPNPLLNLVDLARRTKNVRLGTQHIALRCPAEPGQPRGGAYVELSREGVADVTDPALRIMLERLADEARVGAYGIYFGMQDAGRVQRIVEGPTS